ncbi:unnamed protein product [Heligmosomoides polygyrus]|uniref:HECT domain-containing protein n=1 Tax=Heligmosomoides polygyrus TaxID=6339 RepID=A0A183GTR4_HELPZ|nr:unnamed protein product [Heligmosomoides polygyrus]
MAILELPRGRLNPGVGVRLRAIFPFRGIPDSFISLCLGTEWELNEALLLDWEDDLGDLLNRLLRLCCALSMAEALQWLLRLRLKESRL